jgi:hypothetical protein
MTDIRDPIVCELLKVARGWAEVPRVLGEEPLKSPEAAASGEPCGAGGLYATDISSSVSALYTPGHLA